MVKKQWKVGLRPALDIPAKTNRVLAVIFFCLLAVVVRIWHLGVVEAEERREEARRPQRRVVVERAERGTITDRFGLPLAVNRIQFSVGVRYADLRSVAAVVVERDGEGRKVKRYPRREYIERFSKFLGQVLGLDAGHVEDQIYSRAALFPDVPFVLKEEVTESVYYRLKALEQDWPGLVAERASRRVYPMGRVAGDLVGYMGAISREQYEVFAEEMTRLEGWLERWRLGEETVFPNGFGTMEEVENRLGEMRDKAYSLNDDVGRTGVEEGFEERLRGFRGKRFFYSDARGNFLRELEGGQPRKAGECIRLTISAELQEYAEELLVRSESIREGRSTYKDPKTLEVHTLPQPWIKGGAIVAMDPRSGDLLALATHPRLDPNDFLKGAAGGAQKIHRWLEDEVHLAALWNQQEPLVRERFLDGEVKEEKLWLSWDQYLAFILPEGNGLRPILGGEMQIRDAVELQAAVEELMALTQQASPTTLFNLLYPSEEGHRLFRQAVLSRPEREALDQALVVSAERIAVLRRVLDRYFSRIPYNYDKLLLVDLCRVAVDHRLFSPGLLRKVGYYSLADFREATAAVQTLLSKVEGVVARQFHHSDFKDWRENQQADFLRQKRLEEKEKGRYQRPYMDYLEREKKAQFRAFWQAYRLWFLRYHIAREVPAELAIRPDLQPYFKVVEQLEEAWAIGGDQRLQKATQVLERLRTDLSDGRLLFQYVSSMRSYDQLTRSLYGRYRGLRRENGVQLEKHLASAFYPRYGFGFGRSFAYRYGVAQGSLFKLVVAYEALIQRYRQVVEETPFRHSLNPLEIVDQTHRQPGTKSTWNVGFFTNGQPIPQRYKGGRIPKSTSRHIGHVDLPKAIEWSSNPYFALLAVDHLSEPNDLIRAAQEFGYGSRSGIELPGETAGRLPGELEGNPTGLYEFSIGQHQFVASPIQSAVMISSLVNGGHIVKPTVALREDITRLPAPRRDVLMPDEVANLLLDGMERAAKRGQTRSSYVLNRYYQDFPEAVRNFSSMKGQLLGKTSTSEVVETVNLDWDYGTNVYNHIWFGSAIRGEEGVGDPELVVIIFLRYGGYGMEAAPLASEVAKKWREIQRKHA